MTSKLVFIGVNTTGSAVRRVFPQWMELLGRDVELATVDIPLGAPEHEFQAAVEAIRDDPETIGATVTAHKTMIFEAAASLFAEISPDAQRLGEISVIRPQPGGLHGSVIEQESIARTLAQLGGQGQPFLSDDAHLVIYGAGGTTAALITCLTAQDWPDASRPSRIHLIDTDPARLMHVTRLAATGAHPIPVTEHLTTGTHDLGSLGPLPASSVVINATGLGKDRPGSPVQHPAPWPKQATVWDLNYRGDLVFLDDAKAANKARGLRAVDGWELFINGWAEGLERILDRPIDHVERYRMSEAAKGSRT